MYTETTDKKEANGWLFYDAECRICVRLARRYRDILVRRGIELLPLQTPGAGERLGLCAGDILEEMRLLLPDGKVVGGAEAVVEVSRRFWWAWPFYLIGRTTPMRLLLRAAYRWIARRRACVACK